MIKDEKYYRELSEVYLFELENMRKDAIKISIAMGVIVSMESDLIIYENKMATIDEKGNRVRVQNERSKEQWDRLNMLRNSIEYFQTIGAKNDLLRERLKVETEAKWEAQNKLKAASDELAQLKQSISLHEGE